MTLTEHAYHLLKSNPDFLEDARQGIAVGNTIVGGIMQVTLSQPRQYTEEAVREAVAQIDAEQPAAQEPAQELTFWFRQPRDFTNEYDVGIATTEPDAAQYKAEQYRKIDQEVVLERLSRRAGSGEQLYITVTIDGEPVLDRFTLARRIRKGEPIASGPRSS